MTKLTLPIKQLVLNSKPQAWLQYAVFAGLILKLLISQTPVASAQVALFSDFGQSALEAIHNPYLASVGASVASGFIMHDNSFAQSLGFIISPEEEVKVAATENQPEVRQAIQWVVKDTRKVIVTAYSSTPDQTDDTPFISANGTYVYDGMVACNFLPFGTKVRFPDIYGDKIFTVEDRMALRNSHKIDVWMPDRQTALQFGVRHLAVEILE